MIHTFTIYDLAKVIGGKLVQAGTSGSIEHITTDSRDIGLGNKSVYLALKGVKFDGHEFLSSVYDSGVRSFILNENQIPSLSTGLTDANILAVPDTLDALQKTAEWNRSKFTGTVIGITGSNGKTIVKEWLGQVVGKIHPVAKSPKSYNSQIGVPLSVLGINDYHALAILEAGISRTGEMEKLEGIIKPTIGILTNLGSAHQEGFNDREEKLKEKIKLFANSKYVIYRKDQREVTEMLEDVFPEEKLIAWSEQPGTDYTLSIKRSAGGSTILLMKPDLTIHTFRTDFTDEASLENLRHVIVACLTLGLDPEAIDLGIQELRPVEMRLTLKEGQNNNTIIDDTYNNDLVGLSVALDFLLQQRPKKRKILILSDLLQAGENNKVYAKVASLVQQHGIDFIFGVGENIRVLGDIFPEISKIYSNTDDLISSGELAELDSDLILVKGARKFEFEKIVNHLQEKIHGTVLEINLNALAHNYNFYKKRLRPETKIMVMVKAFAYGGGAVEIANHLQQMKADYLAVAYTDEGTYLRNHGIHLPIMVLNPERESFPNLLKYNLDPVVYSLPFFKSLAQFVLAQKSTMNIHLDLDTGMHRLGFVEDDIPELGRLLTENRCLKVASVYTHLAGADEPIHHEFSLHQLALFTEMFHKLEGILNYSPLKHALNSAGIIRFPEHQFDMVRLGIGLYGIGVSEGLDLQPISTLKTSISQIKILAKGRTIGYGRKGVMLEDGQIATIPIGYADGYDRRFGNGVGYVLIKGKKAPVIGNVCMDMCMVDVTGMDVRVGDEAIIYGKGISVKELAGKIGTIPYELLTNISDRVKRVYYSD